MSCLAKVQSHTGSVSTNASETPTLKRVWPWVGLRPGGNRRVMTIFFGDKVSRFIIKGTKKCLSAYVNEGFSKENCYLFLWTYWQMRLCADERRSYRRSIWTYDLTRWRPSGPRHGLRALARWLGKSVKNFMLGVIIALWGQMRILGVTVTTLIPQGVPRKQSRDSRPLAGVHSRSRGLLCFVLVVRPINM